MKVQLPASIASAISTIRWPLGPSSCPPLYFQSLESMREIRSKHPIQLDTNVALGELTSDIPAVLATLFPSDTGNMDKRHFGMVSLALIFIGNGLTDEAHDIVTPLSWPEDTHFGYGPSVFSQVSPAAQSFATYVHCLVHRREAFNIGEFGIVGFSNANYWSNAVLRSSGAQLLPHQDLQRHIKQLVMKYKNDPAVEEWARRHDIIAESGSEESSQYFESRMVHELCANVLRRATQDDLTKFAELVAETEVRILLTHALQLAGYECSVEYVLQQRGEAQCATVSADETLALVAANKVSSAHLGIFQSNRVVTLRNVVDADKLCSKTAPSVAAGIAARLLQCQACRLVTSPNDNRCSQNLKKIWVAVPTSLAEAESIDNASGGGLLAPGDVIARLQLESSKSFERSPWFCLLECEATESNSFFFDRLYGTRGETPTTVVQWSKGTIF